MGYQMDVAEYVNDEPIYFDVVRCKNTFEILYYKVWYLSDYYEYTYIGDAVQYIKFQQVEQWAICPVCNAEDTDLHFDGYQQQHDEIQMISQEYRCHHCEVAWVIEHDDQDQTTIVHDPVDIADLDDESE